MNKILALALLTVSLTSFPLATASFAAETGAAANNPLCGPDGPEGYKRPGGFCEQLNSNKSIVEHEDDGCNYLYYPTLFLLTPGQELLVADNCYIN